MKAYWTPDPARVASVVATIDDEDTVIEFGEPTLARANDSIGPQAKWHCDLNTARAPIGRQTRSFAYCRHTLSQLWNPVQCLQEMSWVARRGYIEVPSALAELTRYVDENQPWRGRRFSQWVFWVEDSSINLLPKLAIVEHSAIEDEVTRQRHLLNEQRNWNAGMYWDRHIQWKLWDHDSWGMQTYDELLLRALRAYIP